MTQVELAEALGVSTADRVSMWERGRAEPRVAQLRHAAQVLGVEVAELLEPGEQDLRRLRIEHGLEVADLASASGIPAPTLWRWEAGRVGHSALRERVEPLAVALGVPIAEVERALQRSAAKNR